MNWFTKLCRQSGLLIHHAIKPADKQEVSRHVEEKKVGDKMTLRRTTIEEIEIRKDD
jgi:hypothetical protein